MIHGKDLAKLFRAASFSSAAEVEDFVERVGAVSAMDAAKLLPVILELFPKSPTAHRNRCQAFSAIAIASAGPELFVPGLKALRHADPVLQKVIVGLLPRVNDVGAHAELCELLSSTDGGIRAAGAEILRQVGGRTALDILTSRALDPQFPGRLDAMSALVQRAGAHSLPLLVSVLRAGKPQEKLHALRHLASKERFAKNLQGAIDTASLALEERDDLVLAQAITTLGQLDDSDFWDRVEPMVDGHGIEVVRAFLAQAARIADDTIATYFRYRFREGPKAVRLVVIEAIEAAGSDVLFATLVDGLSHHDVTIRTRSAHAVTELSKGGRIDAARAIVWLLRSKDVNVRRVAAEIANRTSDPEGTLATRLLKFLRDEDWWVRERVLDALIELNGKAITKHVITEYLGDASGVVRRFAVSALLRIADPRALGALVRTAQTDTDWLVRELAIEAIGKLGDARASAYLIDLLQRLPEQRVACIDALKLLRSQEALPEVADLVQDEDPDVRRAAIRMLDELDDGTHALWVKGCEDDPSPAVREAAGRLLRRFKLQSAVEAGDNIADLKSLDSLLAHMISHEADDLFLQAGRPPYVKRRGNILPLAKTVMSGQQVRDILQPHLSPEHRAAMDENREFDFSYEHASRGLRFRVNVFAALTGPGAVFRVVKTEIVTLSKLGIPDVVASFAAYPYGLVLVGGPTGAGKSTTLAALIDHINRKTARHIITIEDPVEVVHSRVKSLVNQRELGTHTRSFSAALRSTLRQDPDVILVGELRDLDTIAFAVSAAETGHLVFGTVHTTSAEFTIDRLINAFPAKQQPQVRNMLAESLRAVTCQHLLRGHKGARVPAVEVMINNDAIQSLIRKGKAFQIPSVMATSRDVGMQLMDQELIRLAREKLVEVDEAYVKSVDKRAFEAALGLASPEAAVSQAPAVPSYRAEKVAAAGGIAARAKGA